MKWFITIAIALSFGYLSLEMFIALNNDFQWSDMDWNNDGYTTPFELLESNDIGLRITKDNCKEYYALKDGLNIKIICPENMIEGLNSNK